MAKIDPPVSVGYVLRKFPVLSETFILNEILALESRGVEIKIFSLAPPRDPKFHEGVIRLRAPISFVPGIADYSSLLKYVGAASRRYRGGFYRTLLPVLASARPKLLWRFLQAAYVAERAGRLRIERLHAHFATRATTVARLASRISGIPYSFTAHAFDIYRSGVSPGVLRKKIDDASFVVTISETNLGFLRQVANGSVEKIRLLHNGIDLSTFAPGSSSPQPPFTMLSIARLVEKKGLPVLIEACRELRDRGVPFRCWIVGRGYLRTRLQGMISRWDLGDQVRLLGARRQGELPELYRAASVYVLPAIVASDGNRDGLPVSIVEALACGLPVVSTPVSGISEVVCHERNGILVPERDSRALADALGRLIADRALYERLRSSARLSVTPRFDIKRTSRSLQLMFAGGLA